jgi:hypothetical protein
MVYSRCDRKERPHGVHHPLARQQG